MSNIISMETEKAVMELDKFLTDNPELFKNQRELEKQMQNIEDPKDRFEYLQHEIKNQTKRLNKFLENLGTNL